MAVIWQKRVNGKLYEVRGAGRTRRLYTDGVFHSQYNPAHSLTGNVWDLISLPSFFMPTSQIRRVLVLGVGGGAVLRQLRSWYPDCTITGVELDKAHIYVARRFFKLKDPAIELIEADAIEWVKRYRGMPYDLIIDDLFGESEGEPFRAIEANRHWITHLGRLLSSDGMIVMNFISGRDFRNSCFFHDKVVKKKFRQIFRFVTPLYDNNIGAFLSTKSSVNILRKRIKQHERLAREYPNYQDKYQIRKMAG